MPFPIFRLPSVALQDVIKLMCPQIQFLLSTISRKSDTVVKFYQSRKQNFDLKIELSDSIVVSLFEKPSDGVCIYCDTKLKFEMLCYYDGIEKRSLKNWNIREGVSLLLKVDPMQNLVLIYSKHCAPDLRFLITNLSDLFRIPSISFHFKAYCDTFINSFFTYFLEEKNLKLDRITVRSAKSLTPENLAAILNGCRAASDLNLDFNLTKFENLFLDQNIPGQQEFHPVQYDHLIINHYLHNTSHIESLLGCRKVTFLGTASMQMGVVPLLEKWTDGSQISMLTIETSILYITTIFGCMNVSSVIKQTIRPRWVMEATIEDKVHKFSKQTCFSIYQQDGTEGIGYFKKGKFVLRTDFRDVVYADY